MDENVVLSMQQGDPCHAESFTFRLNDILFWSTRRPNLYALIINLSSIHGVDRFCTQIGFRNITTEGNELRLNDAGFKLAGASLHEERPKPVGRSTTDEHRFEDLQLMQEVNANFWRSHQPCHPMQYIYSDRLGLAVWEESPVYWADQVEMLYGLSRGTYLATWTEIIYRDFNRPSVLFWSACNEPGHTAYLERYMEMLIDWTPLHDPTRILTMAPHSSHMTIEEEFYQQLQIHAHNTYAGTFEGEILDFYNELSNQVTLLEQSFPDKPLISTEWGIWRWANHQYECFQEGFQVFNESDQVQGILWWLAFDYVGSGGAQIHGFGIYDISRSFHYNIYDLAVIYFANFTSGNL
jgi:beta-glucuronidase